MFPGIAAQAATGFFAVFAAMLVVYKVRGLRLSSTRRPPCCGCTSNSSGC
ncbi:hypothetical protein L083_2833 [Actinoplanes sp. N902-109]|nr:hypothetical protein L083_2833 [Actinoplanes sp. N902-109]